MALNTSCPDHTAGAQAQLLKGPWSMLQTLKHLCGKHSGGDKFLHMQRLRQSIAHASLQHIGRPNGIKDLSEHMMYDKDLDDELTRGLYEPEGFDMAPNEPGAAWGQPSEPSILVSEDANDIVCPQTKSYSPNSMVYIDGSSRKTTT